MTSEKPLLEVKSLKTYFFYTKDGTVRAVDGVDFKIDAGEILVNGKVIFFKE